MVYFGRTRTRRSLLTVLSVVLVGTAVPALAGPQDRLEDIRQRQEHVDQKIDALDAESDELLGEIAALDEKRKEVDQIVETLDAQLHDLQGKITRTRDRLAHAQHRIALLEKELHQILQDLQERTDVYSARAVAIYKSGPAVYVDGLLDSENFSDLFDRFAYYQASVDADSELINEIQVLRDETTSRREQVEAERATIAKAKLELEKNRDSLASVRDEQAAVLAQREAVLGKKEAVLAEVETDKASYERLEQQLESDAAAIQNLLASGGSTATGAFPTGGGQLAWPAAGPVTSGYGYRTHPIFGDSRLHTGIDIGASYGAPVVASEDGTVAYVGAMSGYGNTIVVDHGDGLSTTYNHLSAFSVGSGQSVSRGTQIGAVGCTGYCTGPHLHFEVRINGSAVDPMPYLE